jgi:hypothetical protein
MNQSLCQLIDPHVSLALEMAIIAHHSQADKGGQPYILHPLTVAKGARNKEDMIVSILHDVVEDSDFTLEDVAKWGIHLFEIQINPSYKPTRPSCVLEALDCITKRKGEKYEDYMARVMSNEVSLSTKIRDMKHNLDLNRLPKELRSDPGIQNMQAKYNKWLPILEAKLQEIDEAVYPF